MKKKILSFVLAICLIIPCAFMMSACGDNEPKSLAGKTIHCSDLYSDFNFENEIILSYNESGGKYYQKYVSYSELLEMTLGTNAFTYPNNATPTTLDEAKEFFEQKVKSMFCTMSVNPWVHFSDDLTKADLYYTTETIARTYDVEYVDTDCGEYILKLDGVECLGFWATTSDQDSFLPRWSGDYDSNRHFTKEWMDLDLDGECATLVTLTALDGSGATIQKRLDEVFNDDQTINVTLLYTIKK